MSERLPTVTIENDKGGPLIINLSDYDEKKHKLFEDKKAAKEAAAKEAAAKEAAAKEAAAKEAKKVK